MATSGGACITGTLSGSMDLGAKILTASGSNDMFVACFDTAAKLRWAGSFTGGTLAPAAIAGDDTSVFVTGSFTGTVDFGKGPLTAVGANIFVVGFSAAGAAGSAVTQWSTRFGTAGYDAGHGLAYRAPYLYVVGEAASGLSFDGGGPLPNAGNRDAFVACLDSSGGHQWSRSYGGALFDSATAVAATSAAVFVTGSYNSTNLTLGGKTCPAGGNEDIFVVQLQP
jgi:hypothetical protein